MERQELLFLVGDSNPVSCGVDDAAGAVFACCSFNSVADKVICSFLYGFLVGMPVISHKDDEYEREKTMRTLARRFVEPLFVYPSTID